MESLRTTILGAIEALLQDDVDKDNIISSLGYKYENLLEIQNVFLIERILYGPFIHQLQDREVQNDKEWLQTLKNQLLGSKPYVHTYALRYPFIQILEDDVLETYQNLLQIYDHFNLKAHTFKVEEVASNYEELREILFQRYNNIQAKSVADLLVIQASHLLLSLPDDKESFDITEVFSSIYPTPSVVTIASQLDYVQSLLNKLTGNNILYIDAHVLPNASYVINLR